MCLKKLGNILPVTEHFSGWCESLGNPDDCKRTTAMLVDRGQHKDGGTEAERTVDIAGSLTIEGICEPTTVPVKFSWWDVLQELRLTLRNLHSKFGCFPM